ncbi:hypothetical protein [Actinospica robiniae]|uniref:hypothetical protein n=1 Tax=Actinospica robiniae TaxID=304901 RepID=UPI000405B620|nr:hypothetical protein [Actinospica robiniae]
MFFRWLPHARSRAAVPAAGGASGAGAAPVDLAEKHFPLAVVLAHGAFAVTTVILVLIAAIQHKG